MENYEKKWLSFSEKPQSEEDIRREAVLDARDFFKSKYSKVGENKICYSYICKNSKLSESFIEDLMFISSGYYDKEWDDEFHRDLIVSIIDKGFKSTQVRKQYEYLLKLLQDSDIKSKINKKLYTAILERGYDNYRYICDRLDWYYILNCQKLSKEFCRKHKNPIINATDARRFPYFLEGVK